MSNTNTAAALPTVAIRETADGRFLADMPCTGSWQPTYPARQYGANRAEFYCAELRHVVVLTYPGANGETVLHGYADAETARRAAIDWTGYSGAKAEAREVAPYWYVTAFGRVLRA